MTTDLDARLEPLGLSRYAPILRENEADLDALALLGDQDFQQIGIPLGPRKEKPLRAIDAARGLDDAERTAADRARLDVT